MLPLFPLVALLVLSAPTSAQSSPAKHLARYGRPLRSATLDLGTGTLTRGARIQDRSAATVVDFSNLDTGGFTAVDTGGGACEWFEAGKKGTGTGATAGVDNNSDLMNSIVFAYCSAKLDPASGGPGGSVKLGFYEGYQTFGGTPTTPVAALTLTGLPAHSTSSSFFGGFRCFFIRVVFPGLVCFADGPIGYSWRFLDVGTGAIHPLGSVLAATWPFLACVSSCSVGGTCLTVDGQGMDGAIDQYCPPGFLRNTFCFGTIGGISSSISMAIEEVEDTPATVTAFNSATNPNPDALTSAPAVVGQAWSASLTLGLARSQPASWICFFGSGPVNPPNGLAIPRFASGLDFGFSKAGRMLLCALDTGGFACLGTHGGTSGSTSTTSCGGGALPKLFDLVCNGWCAQAVVLGNVPGDGNARLSSAIAGVVGTN